jgi:hypothetical protein
MGRQCNLILNLFLIELLYLGWIERSDAKEPSYLQETDAAVLPNSYLTRSTAPPQKCLDKGLQQFG